MSKKIIYIQILDPKEINENDHNLKELKQNQNNLLFQCDATTIESIINKIKRLFTFNNHGGKREGAGRKKKELKGNVSNTIY